MSELTSALNRVESARETLRKASKVIDEEQRIEKQKKLATLDAAIDLAIQDAAAAGGSIAAIQRAYGTTDYRTIKERLQRSYGSPDGTEGRYTLVDGVLKAIISGHIAEFEVIEMEDEGFFFNAVGEYLEPDGSINKARAALDGRVDGEEYNKAVAWMKEQK